MKSLAPPPLPLLVGVLNATSPSFGSGWYATFNRDNKQIFVFYRQNKLRSFFYLKNFQEFLFPLLKKCQEC